MTVLPLTIAVLVAGGVYLLLQPGLVRIVFGITLLSHAANLILLAAGVSAWRGEPLHEGPGVADPLPMAFVLTAIVITLAVTVLMLALARLGGNDDTYVMPDTEPRPEDDHERGTGETEERPA
ncbi:sodium:proton antiporter [Nocardioides bruguierae]|uniref:Cation:proton antiporter subunit C n=1 Tax=Nocardioides bruguierae TaxID=2945102 RepID=A0A9X2D9S3_9ACTN|nr:cation:proton antiporter subunit C [Nocardioides bruguierae]MCL8027444.1 cation:proton antiporter subunit C [Nocardioides bruguierae]MCM0620714.1 cation:proton antiporter subunit C [Nocardioides bruguierae]